ncbi:MAG: sigma-54-dependent Fis family transcriptional regulator [bacterium]|nr:sigma-54-dependent Fis family transcriptional regulator [bacterium]
MSIVLVVEDDAKIRANLVFSLKELGLDPLAVGDAEGALEKLERLGEFQPDLFLVDVRLPGMSGVEFVRTLADQERLGPTIVISGEASVTEAVEALRLGVFDFIEKPFSAERLNQSIRNALEHARLRSEIKSLRAVHEPEILGESPLVVELKQRLERAANSQSSVLIQGESGSGKELVANALHRQSDRSEAAFVKINCAAIPANLVEDELFGHVKGAFTDARLDKPGLFEEADRGIFFLDEIGDMEPQLQARLLRVLEDGLVRRVGDTRDRQVDVRIFAATNQNLEVAIADRRFRQDLYYRLAQLVIEVPPLRARGTDIKLLFDHFVAASCRSNRLRTRIVDEDVYCLLGQYSWPGNVREIRNLCERLVVFGGNRIKVEDLPSQIGAASPGRESSLLMLDQHLPAMPLREFKTLCEKEYLERVLQRAGWNFAVAARSLGIQRTYLHQKVTALGIERPGG